MAAGQSTFSAASRPDLSSVTLVSVTGVGTDAAQLAMQHCLAGLDFGRALLIASSPPTEPDPRIEHVPVGPLNYRGYSHFLLKELHRYIETSHALIVQADGFVLNPDRWDPAWLDYDYIGAPLPEKILANGVIIELTNRVGNGGFSLRSQRLLQLVSPINLQTMRYPTHNEDMVTCHLLHDYLVSKGMRFADIETAADFAIDEEPMGRTLGTTLGFHGKANLQQLRDTGVLRSP